MSSTRPPTRDDMWTFDDENPHTVRAEGWPTITVPTRSTRDAPPATVESPPPEGDGGQRDTAVDTHSPEDASSIRTPDKTRSGVRKKIISLLGLLTVGSVAITGIIRYKKSRSPNNTSSQTDNRKKQPTAHPTKSSGDKPIETAELLPSTIKIQIEVKADYGKLVVVKIQADPKVSQAVRQQIKYLAFLPDGEASTNSSGELEQKGKLLIPTQDGRTITYTLNQPLRVPFDGSSRTIEVTATK